MSVFKQPAPARLVVSLLFDGGADQATDLPPIAVEALAGLEAAYGVADLKSPVLPFEFTRYYEPEMGANLRRIMVAFAALVAPERLVEIKHFTAALEQKLAAPDGRRRVNLDPGLVTVDNFILATGKKNPHRVYLREGVYADLTLIYKSGHFAPLPWTYPDYASPDLKDWIESVRARLLEDLRAASHPGIAY